MTKDIKEYVFLLLQNDLPSDIIYHNFSHTLRVVKKIKELVDGEGVNSNEALLLEIAAWFHDTGYVNGEKNHEEDQIDYILSNKDPLLSGIRLEDTIHISDHYPILAEYYLYTN